jgi:AcrR family transcriptional regulator
MVAGTSRRDEVLSHARRVIMRDGLDATSLRRIAREGGFTTGVLTHYFTDKRELIAACFEWTMRTWLDRVERELGEAPTAEASVVAFVDMAVPLSAERHGEWRLWLDFCSSASGRGDLTELLVAVERRYEEVAASALRRWQDAGVLAFELPVEQQAVILVRLADGLGLRALVTGDWADARATFVAALVALGLTDGAAHVLAPTPGGEG